MKLTLISKKEESKDVTSFFFKPEKSLTWMPGQYVYITIPEKLSDKRGNSRELTISSSPTENHIQITTKLNIKSGFKKALWALNAGSFVDGDGPHGTFFPTTKEIKDSMIFFAGGIGITPFRSIIKSAFDLKLKLNCTLVYSNTGPEFIFKEELDFWNSKIKGLKIQYIDSAKEKHIDEKSIQCLLTNENLRGLRVRGFSPKGDLHTGSIHQCTHWPSYAYPRAKAHGFLESFNKSERKTFWISGPAGFVSSIENILTKMGINSDSIRLDKFTGY